MHTEQLQVMVKNLRAECGHSLNVAHGVNQVDTLKYLLARTQEELWTAFVWPELTGWRAIALTPGQYIYDYPDNISFDGIREVWTCPSTEGVVSPQPPHWTPVSYGTYTQDIVGPPGVPYERRDPVEIWDTTEGGTGFTVWPVPDTSTWVRFVCQKPLNPLLSDYDYSTLDATSIVLFAAADLLARAKAEDASIKMQKAQRHLSKLLSNKVSAKHKVSTLGGGSPRRNAQTNGGLQFNRGF